MEKVLIILSDRNSSSGIAFIDKLREMNSDAPVMLKTQKEADEHQSLISGLHWVAEVNEKTISYKKYLVTYREIVFGKRCETQVIE